MPVQKRRSFSSIERPSALAGGAKTPDHSSLRRPVTANIGWYVISEIWLLFWELP